VDHGDPATYITAQAEKNDVDLIMMATHGYGTFRSLLLGSVAAKVLHDAKLARKYGAKLRLVHAVPVIETLPEK
jgi:nucleotide-binding universal stress UspA family protein